MDAMDDPVAVLRRWEDAGGMWRVLTSRAGEITVGLFRCDGGEQVDEVRSATPGFAVYLAGRISNLD